MNEDKNWMSPKENSISQMVFWAILIVIVSLAVGYLIGHRSRPIPSQQTVLVPSTDYAKPYDVCQGGFPFVVMTTQVDTDKKNDTTTWVTGHPLGQRQVIVCAKEGDYDDVWVKGRIISLAGAVAS